MASRLRKKRRGKKLLADEDDRSPPPAWAPLHAIHWKVGVGENKTRFLDVWLPDTDPDGITFYYEQYEARGAAFLGRSRSGRFNTRFRGYRATITKWGHDTKAGRFYFWDDRGMRYTGLFNYRNDGKDQQSEREILSILRKVKKTSDFFEPPPEHELLHPLPGEPPVPRPPTPPRPPRRRRTPQSQPAFPSPKEFERLIQLATHMLAQMKSEGGFT